MDESVETSLYKRLIAINQDAFEAGLFDTAYHALAAALHCAEHIHDNEPLLKIGRVAEEQLAWIDKHDPDYSHSTRSAQVRNHKSIFENLSNQAKTLIKMRKFNVTR